MSRKLILGVLILLGPTAGAFAEPALQLYLEGATYDSATETWTLTTAGDFKLWVIAWTGNGRGAIEDVKLSAAYAAGQSPTITLAPGTTEGLGSFTDTSTPGAPTDWRTVTDGSTPLLSDGTPLPSHGVFGPDTWWQEWKLGDFTLADSPIADFIGTFPSPGSHTGQINVYTVSVTGALTVQFDTYNHYAGATNAKFAPFSHNASGSHTPVPAAAVLGLAGLATINLLRRRLLTM